MKYSADIEDCWKNNRYWKLSIRKRCKFYCACDMEMVGKGDRCSNYPHTIGGGKRKLVKY